VGAPFGGCYWDTPEGRVFSLRSTDDGLDADLRDLEITELRDAYKMGHDNLRSAILAALDEVSGDE